MESKNQYLICPNPHPTEVNRNCFFIKKETAASYLLDPEHPANFCLSVHERATVEDSIKELGVVLQ